MHNAFNTSLLPLHSFTEAADVARPPVDPLPLRVGMDRLCDITGGEM